jgi:pseudouridine-5'-phosphate glycosidase
MQSLSTLQVILGRATIDSEVDINLGEEGRANKVSRRQVGFVLAFLMQLFCIFVCIDGW